MKPEQGVIQNMGWRVIRDADAFQAIQARFRTTKDSSGKSMQEVCDNYWKEKKRERGV